MTAPGPSADPIGAVAAGRIRPTGRAGRGAKTLGDMLRSLIFVMIAIVVLFGSFLFTEYDYHGGTKVQRLDSDLAETLVTARAQAPYALLAPAGLPHAWAPSSVSWAPSQQGSPSVLQIGYVTPSSKFLDFVESNGAIDGLLSAYESSPVPAGTAIVAGVTYAVTRSTDGSLTYLRQGAGPHVGVNGGATRAEIEQFLATLK